MAGHFSPPRQSRSRSSSSSSSSVAPSATDHQYYRHQQQQQQQHHPYNNPPHNPYHTSHRNTHHSNHQRTGDDSNPHTSSSMGSVVLDQTFDYSHQYGQQYGQQYRQYQQHRQQHGQQYGQQYGQQHYEPQYDPDYHQGDGSEPRPPAYEPFSEDERYSHRSTSPSPDNQLSQAVGVNSREPSPARRQPDTAMAYSQRDSGSDGRRGATSHSGPTNNRYSHDGRDHSHRGDRAAGRRRPRGEGHRHDLQGERQARKQSSLEDWMYAGDKLFGTRRR